jgi:glycosidase
MDVAPWVPDDFWRDWRGAVKRHRPDALTVAETQFEAAKFFLGDEFDSTMNYIFRNAVQDYANGADARVIYRNIELMRENYPPQAFYASMNLLSTHDSARALFDFGFRDDKTDAGAIALAKQRLRLAAFFQMTFPGAPAVFYGDEVGVTGGEDPAQSRHLSVGRPRRQARRRPACRLQGTDQDAQATPGPAPRQHRRAGIRRRPRHRIDSSRRGSGGQSRPRTMTRARIR